MVSVFPVKNFNGDQIGVIAFVYNASDLFNSLTTIRWGVALLCLALALGVGIPLVFAVRGVTAPLNRIISALSDSAHQVADASGQVSEASQILAEGATEQAASIEETSASLEEISSVARQNADNSKEANTLMVHTGEVVTRADQSMEELNRSMADINTAGQEISKIIKTIDEIAFQTNLLALNAAVEAARAGEAGAGFAVVADEVRNLALRAAEAARDTSGMIEQTIDRVSKGTDIVNRTNEAFTEVRQSSGKVGELIGNIAGASDEQAQGVEQVNTAVSHMDRVVHQNAASAEESASASRELSSQAEQMKEVVRDLTAIANGRNEKTAAAQAALAASPAKQLPQEARQIRGLPLKKS
ncbi:MAG: hypothetical protein HUN04_16885 [Desulfobacter sp.]|nr:MAG: hypothetical protein HUN04_16885 [Desulfobacter sp.]